MPKLNLTIDLDPACGEEEMKAACRTLKAQTYASALHEIDEQARNVLKHCGSAEDFESALRSIRETVAAAYDTSEGV